MQVIPKYAAAPPISISHVDVAQNNIEAGAGRCSITSPKRISTTTNWMPPTRPSWSLQPYNAGPTRITRLEKKAAAQGLNPNRWFGNVELVAAKDIGQETVQYVSNIFKYYVAYKLTLAETKDQKPQ